MNDVDDIRRKQTEKLVAQGFEHLEKDEPEKALELAAELEKLRFSAAFEIAALANAALGDLDESIRVLERGVETAPDCWLNWQLLGNFYSDIEQYDKADLTYKKALNCTDVWRDSVLLNQAILDNRKQNYSSTLSILNKIDDKELYFQKCETNITALQGLGRIEEAIEVAERILQAPWNEERDGEVLGRIAASLGRMRLLESRPKDEIRKWAMQSLSFDASNDSLLALIRDIDSRYSKSAKYFRILIHCKLPDVGPKNIAAKGFYTTYDIVADNLGEALELVREFEDKELRGNLVIEEAEELELRPDSPIGVYRRTGHTLYENDEE